MKKLIIFTFALFLLNPIAPIAHASEDTKTDDIVVQVNGMVCDFCAQSLKKVFGKEPSVNGIDVNLDEQLVAIDVKDGAEISDDKIKELIEWGGYDLIEIKRQ